MPLYKPAIDYKNTGVISYDEFEFYSYIWRNSADRFSSECEGWENTRENKKRNDVMKQNK